ncbi:MAG TPA: polyamine ABC transporter substrate-binding protein [Povalibacter sp.]|uniref:polyamine ABC transporter substrate-binding protein n=1 Tax=Povalibacter sp. TaxID=1962978 RepID=UPI002B78E647|nr:polyamine ABC transporter substrate-binding protein [Povalibacter sp.]HMN47196.1 polyamine ABC transporter substrate-binding protein [Povalibacter sp.]
MLFAIAGCGKKESTTEQAAAPGAPTAGQEEPVVNVFNWSDYIDEEVLKKFEQDTGIKVRYDVFDSNEILETRLLSGTSGYDLVVPSAYFLERQIKAGVFRKLDKSQLPNLANVDPDIAQREAAHDPDNAHSVVYMWGTTGIGYDAGKLQKIMPDAPVDSWRLIFDPAVISKFKDCGVSMLDDPTDMIGTALLYLGRNPNSESAEDLKLAEDALMKIRPFLRTIHSSQYIEQLANGELCIAVGYSGDVLQARDRAEEAGKPLDIRYSIPKEGALMWFDTLAIPIDAAHPGNAHKLIDYLLQPEVAAANSNFVKYANGNAAATPLIDESLRADTSIYPTPEVTARLQPNLTKSADFTRSLNRTWTRFVTGR